ncbi:hypothetical protein Y032_0214g2343 [Ancylostoma ceylanicum]|uniref:Uncharacterized protein n=1 Tax=Ancylostoma ceylanicum TaxID=53326 RepID=A0A016SKB6_9BILA|nr:hypothetical protein Y032_0214g2343 [Ancylostoma ceylanicum]
MTSHLRQQNLFGSSLRLGSVAFGSRLSNWAGSANEVLKNCTKLAAALKSNAILISPRLPKTSGLRHFPVVETRKSEVQKTPEYRKFRKSEVGIPLIPA